MSEPCAARVGESWHHATAIMWFCFTAFLGAGMLAGCVPSKPAHSEPVSLPQYDGALRDAVVAELGEPFHTFHFPMRNAHGELRVELQNTYPLTEPTNADVQIEELWWSDGDYWVTIWLHEVDDQWVVLDSLRWHKSTRF